MMRLKWQPGPHSASTGPYFVSATRFTYQRLWSMPLVFWHGLKLRRSWPNVEGAVGLSIMSDLKTRTTYTVSVWRDESDLLRWVRSADHAPLMRKFRPRLQSSAANTWQTGTFELCAAWREALKKVGLPHRDRDRLEGEAANRNRA
jgi:hypothetical protein